jgi:hypothetical protein
MPSSALPSLIAQVAVTIETPNEFQAHAHRVAQQLDAEQIDALPTFFHNPPAKPADVYDKFERLGEWLSVCQYAIFEILYNCREAALPLVRRVAFGPYDWTQARAIEVLCRFAREGIETETIAIDLSQELPSWRYEAIISTLPALTQCAAIAPSLLKTLHSLIREWETDPDPIDAFEVIWYLSTTVPEAVRQYEPFIRRLMRGEGLHDRSPLMDGQVVVTAVDDHVLEAVAKSGPSYPAIPDYHAIRAAFTLVRLFPADEEEEALAALHRWITTHPDPTIRQEIAATLDRVLSSRT